MKTRLLLLLAIWILDGIRATGAPASTARYVDGELLVKFRGGPRGLAAERARATLNHWVRRHFDFIGWQHIRLPAGMTVEQGLARYRDHPDVLAAEPNAIREHAAGEANNPSVDPLLHQQWNLERIGAPYAWAAAAAVTNVVLAILDTGVNYLHEDLRDSMWRNPGEIPGNRIDDDANGYVDDVFGIDTANDGFGNDSDPLDQGVNASPGGLRIYHGTACAGIAAAAHNGVGVAGVGTSVKIMALRTLQVGDTIALADTIEALNYLIMMKRRGVNVRVTSMSYGGGDFLQAEKDAHDAVAREGILQVNGVHNDSLNLDVTMSYPASYSVSNFLKVAASEGFDNLASFSNYGRNTVHLAAPGVANLSTHAPGTNDYFFSFNGTSSACPLVAGAAALLWSRFPDATVDQVMRSLLESVDVVPALTNRVATGGRLNVARAMSRFISNAPPALITQPHSDSVPSGSPASFRVSVAGTAPLSYQWQFNGTNVPDATTAMLGWPGVTTNNAGSYRVVASNPFGAVTSAVVTLTVAPEPATFTRITSGTIATTAANSVAGAWADYDNDGFLDLFVTGESGVNRLYHNTGDGRFRRVSTGRVSTDEGGSATASWGDFNNDGFQDLLVCKIGVPSVLYRNDGNSDRWLRVKCRGTVSNRSGIGAKVRVRAVVGGVERWQLREIGKGHSYGQSELAASFGLGDAGVVEVLRVEWPSGIVQELNQIAPNQVITLTEPGLRILKSPQPLNVLAGRNATNFVSALSDRPLSYQWLINGANVAGETSATLILTNVQLPQEGDYSVIVSDGLRSSTSAVGRLTVLIPPAFVQAPANQTVVAGGTLTLSAAISGRPAPFTYSWRRTSPSVVFTNAVTDALVNFVTLNTTAAGLALVDNMLATNISCRLVVSNAAVSGPGIAQSFTVTVQADADHDGLPDVWELTYGLTAPDADADGDGVSNRDEYVAGTNPTDALDYLRVRRVDRVAGNPGGISLEFVAVSNLTYTVERTERLEPGAWSKLADIIARPTNRVEVLVDPVAEPRHYYRLVTPRQP